MIVTLLVMYCMLAVYWLETCVVDCFFEKHMESIVFAFGVVVYSITILLLAGAIHYVITIVCFVGT